MLVVLLFASAYLVSRATDRTMNRLAAQTPNIKRLAGWILTGVGVWMIALVGFGDFTTDVLLV